MFFRSASCQPEQVNRLPRIGGCLSNLFYLLATATLFLAILLWLFTLFDKIQKNNHSDDDCKENELDTELASTNTFLLLILSLIFAVLTLVQHKYE